MSSPLVKPDLELSPLSLLIFADVAEAPKGKRRFDRVDTLLNATTMGSAGGRAVPSPVMALEKAGLVEVRRATPGKSTGKPSEKTPGWSIEITDRGLTLHRCLMAAIRNAGALVAQ